MKQTALFIIGFFIILSACSTRGHYAPEGLRKLNEDEIIEQVLAGVSYINDQTVFKDTMGNIIPREDLRSLDKEAYFGDPYVNSQNVVVEVVVRKSTQQDKDFKQRLGVAFEEKKTNESESITLIDVDCSELKSILERVLKSDQETRTNGSGIDEGIDKENQQLVVSIIENCGFPTAEQHGSKSVEAVFLVIQHAGKKLRETYFPLIKQSAEKGDIPWNRVALMEDRMLMDKGEKQKYGSQLRKDHGSSEWEVWPIEDPENVNKRRAEVGLEPIEEYVRHFGIEYNGCK